MARDILVINAGSSSIKTSLFEPQPGGLKLLKSGLIDGIGTPRPGAKMKDAAGKTVLEKKWEGGAGPRDHKAAMRIVVEELTRGRPDWKPAGIGHRVLHGGVYYQSPQRLDDQVLGRLRDLVPLGPLHQAPNILGIEGAEQAFPGVPNVACFDTAFHAGRPFVADAYALPLAYYEQGVRRYGFHGLSYEYVSARLREVAPGIARGKVVVCHLGNGSSMAAIKDGRCAETSMGFTANEGLPMGTRCGQIDPGVLLYLFDEKGMTHKQVNDLLYKQSGLLGLSGVSSDMRDLLASDKPEAKQALDYFVYRIAWYVGAFTAALEGLDGLVFTGGIGENATPIREWVCRRLAWLGVDLDPAANAAGGPRITTPSSRVAAWVVPTNEELMIARHVVNLLGLKP